MKSRNTIWINSISLDFLARNLIHVPKIREDEGSIINRYDTIDLSVDFSSLFLIQSRATLIDKRIDLWIVIISKVPHPITSEDIPQILIRINAAALPNQDQIKAL